VFEPDSPTATTDGMAELVGNARPFFFQVKCNSRSAFPDTFALKVKKWETYREVTRTGFPLVLFIVNVPHQMIYRQDLVKLEETYKAIVDGKTRYFPHRVQLRDLKSGMQSNIEYHMGQFEQYCKLSMEEVAALTLAAK
jgi:hypothetical protein